MGKRPKRKLILFLVEGPSDQTALEYSIADMYDSINEEYEVFFLLPREGDKLVGDITSKYGATPDKIEMLIGKLYVNEFLKDYGLYPKDIVEIIQIMDIDGVYISDEQIVETKIGGNGKSTYYFNDRIETPSADKIRERNFIKRENMDYLINKESIKIGTKSIKYSAYYFSSNLDHFLHGDANLEQSEKSKKADGFTNKCIKESGFFEHFFCDDKDVTKGMTYQESWQYIKSGNHSLERHSNLNILIERLKS